MSTDFENVSPSSFREFAGNSTEIWNQVVGMQVMHNVWGSCSVEGVSFGELDIPIVVVSGHEVALSHFREGIFGELTVPAAIAEQMREFEKKKTQVEKQRQEEEEQRRQQEAEALQALSEHRARQEALARKARELHIIRLESERREDERRRQLIAKDWAEFQARVNQERAEEQRRADAEKEERRRREAKRKEELEARRRAELEQAARLQAEARQKRASSIRAFCQEQQITSLLHFTRLENLSSILTVGLLGRETLASWPSARRPNFNDAYRLDGFREAICLSIGFPNYKMFNTLSSQDRKKWVVLLLEPYLLWEFDCAFFETNAASNSVKATSLQNRRQFSALVRMFADQNSHTRQSLPITPDYPTDPQAEVLVFEPIDPRYILEVHFYDRITMEDWTADYGQTFPQRYVVNRHFFNARSDYSAWQQPVKSVTPPPPPDEADLIFS